MGEAAVHGGDARGADHVLRQHAEFPDDGLEPALQALPLKEQLVHGRLALRVRSGSRHHVTELQVLCSRDALSDQRVARPGDANIVFLEQHFRADALRQELLGHQQQVDIAAFDGADRVEPQGQYLEAQVGCHAFGPRGNLGH